jgi:hypothetical protein
MYATGSFARFHSYAPLHNHLQSAGITLDKQSRSHCCPIVCHGHLCYRIEKHVPLGYGNSQKQLMATMAKMCVFTLAQHSAMTR